jgi:hypothetical protein
MVPLPGKGMVIYFINLIEEIKKEGQPLPAPLQDMG